MAQKEQVRLMGSVALTLAALAIAGLTYPLQAGAIKSDSKVKASARVTKTDPAGQQVVTLTLAISPGWHLYANPVGLEDLASSQTIVKVVGSNKAVVEYPAGVLVKDKDLGDYKIYEGTVNIPVVVTRAASDTTPLELSVFVQACDPKNCLQPATLKLKVQ